jgi:hypothetical protein
MRKKREEPVELHTACISVVSPNRRLLRHADPSREPRPQPDYFLYSNETNDTVSLDPNSAEWFRWLDGLTSFEFDGQDGDCEVTKQLPSKPGEPAHWIASQQWGDKEYKRYLGQTANLTTSYLEEVAADIEAEVSEKEIGGTGEGDLICLFLPACKGPDQRGWSSIRYRCFLIGEKQGPFG